MPAASPLRKLRTFRYLWLIPGLWLCLAGLGAYFKGGEHITMAVTWLPAIAVAVPLKLSLGNSTGDLALLLLLGLLVVTTLGFLLDLLKLPLRKFGFCSAIGVSAGFALRAHAFISDLTQTSFRDAYRRMDFGRGDRVVALILLVLAVGFYLAVLLSFVATLLGNRRRTESPQSLPDDVQPIG